MARALRPGLYKSNGEISLQPHNKLHTIRTGVSADPAVLTEGSPLQSIYSTCASTSGSTSAEPIYMKSTMTGAGGVGGRARFHMYTNVALGGWSNALKSFAEYGASGRTTGLGSSFCAEIQMSAGTSSGTYSALEAEIVMPTNAVTGVATSFLYCNATGAAVATFDTNGYLLEIGAGITPAAGKFVSANSQTLKCKVEANTRYVVLSQAEDGLTLSGAMTGNAVSITNSALTAGDSYSGIRVAVTAAAANNAYGMAAYFDSTVTGAQANNIYNTGSWINLGATYTLATAKLLVPFEGGMYVDGSATLTNTWFVGLQLQMISTAGAGAPGTSNWFRFNYNDGASGAVDAIFQAANPGSAAFTAGAGTTSTKNGDIAIADIVGTGVVYVRTYDAAG